MRSWLEKFAPFQLLRTAMGHDARSPSEKEATKLGFGPKVADADVEQTVPTQEFQQLIKDLEAKYAWLKQYDVVLVPKSNPLKKDVS
eukprot:g67848.t1